MMKKRMLTALLLSAFCMVCQFAAWAQEKTPVQAQDPVAEQNAKEAQRLFELYCKNIETDRATAIKSLQQAAELGLSDAQLQLGLVYLWGFNDNIPKGNIQKDVEKGIYWLEKAAEQGNKKAAGHLGFTYAQIKMAFPKDMKKAVYWYEKAANQGEKEAAWRLGNLYADGDDVPKDMEKAIYWYEKAANQGDESAVFCLSELGELYAHGDGVPKDLKKAMYLFKEAGQRGSDKIELLYLIEAFTIRNILSLTVILVSFVIMPCSYFFLRRKMKKEKESAIPGTVPDLRYSALFKVSWKNVTFMPWIFLICVCILLFFVYEIYAESDIYDVSLLLDYCLYPRDLIFHLMITMFLLPALCTVMAFSSVALMMALESFKSFKKANPDISSICPANKLCKTCPKYTDCVITTPSRKVLLYTFYLFLIMSICSCFTYGIAMLCFIPIVQSFYINWSRAMVAKLEKTLVNKQ